MSTPLDITQRCLDDLIAAIKKVDQFNSTGGNSPVLHVYSAQELLSGVKGISYPAAAVIYEGMSRAQSNAGESRAGTMAQANYAILIAYDKVSIVQGVDVHTLPMSLLGTLRHSISGLRSPAGHFWQWEVESVVDEDGKALIWGQRWSTRVPVVGATSRPS